jgi:hypothetical protein
MARGAGKAKLGAKGFAQGCEGCAPHCGILAPFPGIASAECFNRCAIESIICDDFKLRAGFGKSDNCG